MFLWILRQFKELRAILITRDTPKQLAAGFAIGVMLGIVPKGNLIAAIFAIILVATKANVATGTVTSIMVTWAAKLLDPLSHRIGLIVLGNATVQQIGKGLYQLPLVPWTSIDNTVVLGSFLIACLLGYPAYRLSVPYFARYLDWRLRRKEAPGQQQGQQQTQDESNAVTDSAVEKSQTDEPTNEPAVAAAPTEPAIVADVVQEANDAEAPAATTSSETTAQDDVVSAAEGSVNQPHCLSAGPSDKDKKSTLITSIASLARTFLARWKGETHSSKPFAMDAAEEAGAEEAAAQETEETAANVRAATEEVEVQATPVEEEAALVQSEARGSLPDQSAPIEADLVENSLGEVPPLPLTPARSSQDGVPQESVPHETVSYDTAACETASYDTVLYDSAGHVVEAGLADSAQGAVREQAALSTASAAVEPDMASDRSRRRRIAGRTPGPFRPLTVPPFHSIQLDSMDDTTDDSSQRGEVA